ncbi:glycosyltransferase family 2 protein [Paenibacillus pinistramenti]|uniref:glycosyltransferase family 2 protein n=1 Tax=Paenibacillus pinistramenti TaxID=1768003 RepID=UPI001EF049D5|nr:glycosyltransferase [Paenibacillus pinistramenti]
MISVIIPVMNERRTLQRVIREAGKVHPQSEIIVIANGCTDGSARLARRLGVHVYEYPEPLGHDVPRAVGARMAKGEVLLFIDGDMIVPAEDLRLFVRHILSGGDIALNSYSGPVHSRQTHPVVSAKHTLNMLLERPDLKGASLTAVPHALSRRAAEMLGADLLSNPPLALAQAVLKGIEVTPVHEVNAGRLNRSRRRAGQDDLLIPLLVGDHMEAIGLILENRGLRGGFSDLERIREKAR